MATVSTLNLISPSMASTTTSQLQTPTFYSKSPILFRLTKLPSFSLPANIFRCRCGALTVNPDHSQTTVFPRSGTMLFSLFLQLGFNEKDTQVILDANSSLTLTPFESIRARIHILQAAGVTGLALSKLIVKRPHILTSQHIGGFLAFILNNSDGMALEGKLVPAHVERILGVADSKVLVGFERKVRLLLDYGVPKDKLVYVLNAVNLTRVFCFRSFEDLDRMLVFLERFGGVDLILRRPVILNYDLDAQLVPRIGFFLELSGGDEAATGSVLRKLPFVLAYTVDHLTNHVEFLKSHAGLSYEEIFKIILVYPSLFSASRERKLQPRIDFLKQCTLESKDIFKFLIKAPLFLSLSFEENLAYKLVFLLKIGYKNGTKELALAMGAVTRCSSKNLQMVIGVFLNYGLSCEDIFDMSKKHPQVLQYNNESLEEKLDYLIEEMGREVGELLAFPAFLGYKFDGRIKHRYEVKRKIDGEKAMSINKLLSVSAARFSKKSKRKSTARVILDMDDTESLS